LDIGLKNRFEALPGFEGLGKALNLRLGNALSLSLGQFPKSRKGHKSCSFSSVKNIFKIFKNAALRNVLNI
jgi:hypothetical protein